MQNEVRSRSPRSPRPAVALVAAAAVLGLAACAKLTAPPDEQGPSAVAVTSAAVRPREPEPKAEAPAPAEPAAPANEKLDIQDTVVGKGAEAKAGDNVKVHYVGTLTNGTEFDSSKKRDRPFEFPLGAGRVIKGWDQGVAGMKVGGKRRLVIPPSLGYGASGAPPVIPPNATLVFEVELLEIVKK